MTAPIQPIPQAPAPGTPRSFASLNPAEQTRIRNNIQLMQSKGAKPEEIDDYLGTHERLAPMSAAPVRAIRAPSYAGAASDATSAAPDQASRRAAMAAEPPIISSGLPREIEQGATFGFGDEINAGARSLFTKSSYTDALANERGILHAYESAHPIVSTAAQIAGGAATGLGAARLLPAAAEVPQAASKLSRISQAFGHAVDVGAIGGAAAGAGTSEGDRLTGAARGAMAGAVVAPVVSGGVAAGKRIVGPVASRAIDAAGVRAPADAVAPLLDDKQGIELTVPQKTARRVGVRSAQDRGDQIVLNTITKGGKSIADLRDAATTASGDKPVTLADLGGEGAQQLAAGARTFTESAAATKTPQVLRRRAENAATRISADMTNASGVQPVNPYELADQMRSAQMAAADENYRNAYAKGAVPDETIDQMLKLPYFDKAYAFAKNLAKLDGRELPERISYVVEPPKVPPTPPGFSDDQWADVVKTMRKQGVPLEHAAPGDLTVRDRFGQLRRDLTHVSDEELEKEWQRLTEMNASEEAAHSAVQEAGYRADYEALPSSERIGRSKRTTDEFGNRIKRQAEDLPDADGMRDADQLAQDNKTVGEFNKSQIVRKARENAIARLQAELKRRESDPTDFNFGENAPAAATREVRTTIPDVEALDMVKRGVDAEIQKNLDKRSIDKAAAVKLQQRLGEFLGKVDAAVPEYGKARQQYAAAERMREALESGRGAINKDPRVIEREIGALETDHEKGLYRYGLQDALNQVIANTRDGAPVAGKLSGSAAARQQLAAIAKDAPSSAELLKRAGEERSMSDANARILGGSNTMDKAGARSAIEDGTSPSDVARMVVSPSRALKFGMKARIKNIMSGVNANNADAVANRLMAGVDTQGGPDRATLMKALDELEALQKKGQLTRAKAQQLLGLPAGEQAGRVIGPKK